MSQTADTDAVDHLLSGFFKGELKRRPWPPAPAVGLAAPAASRTRPVAAADPGNRARLTLAASVAFLLGTCWYLSNGSQPADRPVAPKSGVPSGVNVNEGTADGNKAGPLGAIKEGKAKKDKDPKAGFDMGPVTLP